MMIKSLHVDIAVLIPYLRDTQVFRNSIVMYV